MLVEIPEARLAFQPLNNDGDLLRYPSGTIAKRKQGERGLQLTFGLRARFTGPLRQRGETNTVSETFPRPPIPRWRQGRPISPHRVLFRSPHQPFQADVIIEFLAEFPKVWAASR